MTSGSRTLAAILLGTGLAAAPLLVAAGPPALFPDGPPAAVTGGFGEDSCYACHFDGTLEDPPGTLALNGLPDRFTPGETYRLEVVLAEAGMGVGGFQLAARHAREGTRAGRLAPGEGEEERVALNAEREQYIQHLGGGIGLTAPDTVRWAVAWTAPEADVPVTFHVSAVAGDHDTSQFGDQVYTAEVKSRAR